MASIYKRDQQEKRGSIIFLSWQDLHVKNRTRIPKLVFVSRNGKLLPMLHLGIPWGAFLIIFGFVAYMVSHIAGKTTLAQIGMSFIGDIRISDAVAYIFGGSGFAYGLNERRLRHKKTASMAGYSALLETKIHPGRTSSGLTPKGTTRKEDKL